MGQSGVRNLPVRFAASWASLWLDMVRGLAALCVLGEHWRNLFFLDFPQLHSHRLFWAVPYILTGAGHQAVVVFFVLSGYFIGGKVLRLYETKSWQWSDYLLQRIVRLWTVLIPALLLGLYWDRLGIYLGHAPALYTNHLHNNMFINAVPKLTVGIFFGNLFFLQSIHTTVFGSNNALWSLAFEFWYYMLFPVLVTALWHGHRIAYRLAAALLFIALACFAGREVCLGLPIWLLGVALSRVPAPSFAPQMAKRVCIVATLLYVPFFFAADHIPFSSGYIADYVLAAFTSLFLWLLLSSKTAYPAQAVTARASRTLARFSFSLYSLHTPFLVFCVSVFAGESRWRPAFSSVTIGLGVLLTTCAYSYAVASVTEFRTDIIRRRIEKMCGIKPASTALPTGSLSKAA